MNLFFVTSADHLLLPQTVTHTLGYRCITLGVGGIFMHALVFDQIYLFTRAWGK